MILQDERDRAGPIVDRVNAAIRENPLAAGLIGAGLAWMLMGGTKGFSTLAGAAAGAGKGAANLAGAAANLAGAGAANAAATGGAAANKLNNAASTAAARAKDTVSDAASSVGSLVPGLTVPDTDRAVAAVADAKAAVGDRLDAAATSTREYATALQSRLSESLEKQPLLLGAIGLAIGVGMASTFATTSVESELMGSQGSAAREKLQALAGEATDRAKQVVSDVTDEASRQGFTSDGAVKAAAAVSERLKVVASAGKDALTRQEAP
jgi:hypothetical protein